MTTRQRERALAFLGEKVDRTGSCHLWRGAKMTSGYGQHRVGRKNYYAHRLAYELLVGPIPEGHHLHHTCETPLCVNPAHLVPLTPSDHWRIGNNASARRARQTHCKRGHAFSALNTYVRANGQRRCRRCHTDAQLERQRSAA